MVSKKCLIGNLPTEVGLEAGYNLLPVMEDKNLLAMNTVYTGHTASSDSDKQLRHPIGPRSQFLESTSSGQA